MNPERYRRVVETLSRRQPDLSVAMENVHKSRNLGAIARTCDAVGIGDINAIVPAGEPLNLGHKTAGGTEKWLQVHRHESVASAYTAFRAAGLQILAADVGAGTVDYREMDYLRPTILVLGSELDGLSPEASAQADARVHVPLKGMVESLNVSVATGIVLYEAARQREQAGCYDSRRLDDATYSTMLFEWLHPSIAEYCRRRGIAYPALGDDGEVCEVVNGNERAGFASIAQS